MFQQAINYLDKREDGVMVTIADIPNFGATYKLLNLKDFIELSSSSNGACSIILFSGISTNKSTTRKVSFILALYNFLPYFAPMLKAERRNSFCLRL